MLVNDDDMITYDKTLAKTFHEHYINTVERSSGLKPEKMKFKIHLISAEIFYIDRYKNHPSICKTKPEVSSKSFSDSDFSCNILVTSDEVEKMLKSLNSKKAAGTDRLLIKLVKLSSEVLSKPVAMNNRLLEEWRQHLDNNNVVGVFLWTNQKLSTAYHTIA